jgi:hypothetical protein
MSFKYKNAEEPRPKFQKCDWPECYEMGQFEAPKTREDTHDYHYFCLEHVRAYNAKWNFYAGLSTDEVERLNRQDTLWERPTWPFGTNPKKPAQQSNRWHDPFNFFESILHTETKKQAPSGLPPEIAKAADILGLIPPLTMEDLKKAYKALVKKLHPDINGGDPAHAEAFKAVGQAYHTIKTYLKL